MLTCGSNEGRGGSGAEFGVEWEEGGLGLSLRGEAVVGTVVRAFFCLAAIMET